MTTQKTTVEGQILTQNKVEGGFNFAIEGIEKPVFVKENEYVKGVSPKVGEVAVVSFFIAQALGAEEVIAAFSFSGKTPKPSEDSSKVKRSEEVNTTDRRSNLNKKE